MNLKRFTDKCLPDNAWIIDKIQTENCHQLSKWGVQTATIFEWLAWLTEELGETANAISEHCYRDGLKQDVIDEAIQVATLALKIAEMYTHSYPSSDSPPHAQVPPEDPTPTPT